MNNETSRKVLIVSASIGTGHMQAARAIEEYWKEKEPHASITHVDFLDTETMSVEHLIKGTYIKMIDVFPMLYDMIYRVSKGERRGTILQTALSYLLKSRMLKLVQQEQPDVMVFTHPFPCGAASILKRQGHIDVPLVAIMTDFSSHQFWLYPQIDTYYVATESMVTEMVSAGIDEARIHVKVLVMGGGLGLGSLETALKHLDEVNGIGEITVVAGQNTSLYESLVTLSDSMKTKTTVYGYTTNISELMKSSSLLVTKPGALTCMEAVTIGLPMVFFNAIPGQEEANAELLERRGCARWARDIHNLEDVVTALLINSPRLQQMSESAREWHVDGAANIVNSLIEILDATKQEELVQAEEVVG